jgi:hypothetical protein
MKELLNIGDTIGKTDFKVKKIVKSIVKRNTVNRGRIYVRTIFYFIENSKGSQRVLNFKKNKVSNSEMYFPTFGNNRKYKSWNMIKIDSIISE